MYFLTPSTQRESFILTEQRKNSLVPTLLPVQLLGRTKVLSQLVKFAFQRGESQEKHLQVKKEKPREIPSGHVCGSFQPPQCQHATTTLQEERALWSGPVNSEPWQYSKCVCQFQIQIQIKQGQNHPPGKTTASENTNHTDDGQIREGGSCSSTSAVVACVRENQSSVYL